MDEKELDALAALLAKDTNICAEQLCNYYGKVMAPGCACYNEFISNRHELHYKLRNAADSLIAAARRGADLQAVLKYIEISTQPGGQWENRSVCAFAHQALAEDADGL